MEKIEVFEKEPECKAMADKAEKLKKKTLEEDRKANRRAQRGRQEAVGGCRGVQHNLRAWLTENLCLGAKVNCKNERAPFLAKAHKYKRELHIADLCIFFLNLPTTPCLHLCATLSLFCPAAPS